MTELIRFFLQMAMLQRRPQELPDSMFLLQVLLALNLLLNIPLAMGVFAAPGNAVLATLLELGLSAALLFAGLQARGRLQRWRQSYCALLGIGIIGALVGLVYHGVATLLGVPALSAILDLLVFLWLLVAMAHVVRHAFEIPLPFGILVVFAYTMFLLGLLAQWFPPEMVGQTPQ